MRNTNVKNNKKFLGIIILCILALVAGVLALNLGGTSVYAHAAEIECCDNSEHEHSTQATFSELNGMTVLNQAYLSAHYADGTMGMILDETYNPDEVVFEPFAYTHLQRTTVMSSGKPDSQSIVAVFLGDGFDSSDADQDLFLDRVDKIAKYMITVEPFNYYKDYLTVYAVHSISNQSGISGEVGGAFACRNAAGNPATPQCTPVDSAVFNCTHGRDTFYNSYYQWRSSANRVILEMASADRTRARNHALAACSSANMVQVIANSSMRGGTSQMPTASQPLGVALTSINTANPSGDWKEVIMHEFGHGFGGLWDEYWNGITPAEYPNMTKTSSTTTVKWSQWVGYKSVSVYPFAASEWDGNPNQATNPWFRPHQNCMMRQTSNPFCAVCVHELLGRMATATGFTLFNTTNTGTNNIRIDKLNISVSGTFDIPERINGRIVTEIGSSAFANAGMSQISIPASVTHIGAGAFRSNTVLSGFGGDRASIDLVIAAGTKDTYLANGWTGFNVVELSGAGALTVVSGQLRGSFEIPSVFNNRTVTSLGSNAFSSQTQLKRITVPSSVTSIGASAFANMSSYTEIILSNGLVSIGNGAFANCAQLQTIVIPNSVTTMGSKVFSGSTLITIYAEASEKPDGWQNDWAGNRPVFWGGQKPYVSDVITGFGYNGSTYHWNGALRLMAYDEANCYYNSSGMLIIDGRNSPLIFDVRTLSSNNALTAMEGYVTVDLTKPDGTTMRVFVSDLHVSILNFLTMEPWSFTVNTWDLMFDGVYTLTLNSYIQRGSNSSSHTKTFSFEIAQKKQRFTSLMEFGYQGSTFYWNGVVDMVATESYLYTHNSNNEGTILGHTDLAFSIMTVSSNNLVSAILGDLTFVLRNSAGQMIPIGGKSSFVCSVNVNILNTVKLSRPFFIISTAGLDYDTYTLTLTSALSRESWSDTDILTYSFEKRALPSCIAEGSMVTLADGSQAAVENLRGDESLLVWNLQTGTFDVAPILFIDSDPFTEYQIIHLYFSDGTEVKVIYEHGFWDIDLNEYVFLRNDAAKCIGHWFNKQAWDESGNMVWRAVRLVDVKVYKEYNTAYSPVTFGHLCYYVNGMLSIPGATEGLVNIFEVDAAAMQYDMAAMASDIEEYGLFTYEEFYSILPVSEVIFDAIQGQYLKVSIGKGLITIEDLAALAERYAVFFA